MRLSRPFWIAVLACSASTGFAAGEKLAWGGAGCAPAADLRAAVEAALEVAPHGQGRGSGAPGYSVAVEHDECGRFAHAVGRRRIEGRLANQVQTRQHIGSMTKPVTSALVLMLAEEGLLGPKGIDARVSAFFSKAERRQLTKGGGGAKRCPATIQAVDRQTGEFAEVRARCPKLKKITVRQLLNGNHGMWDFVNEVDRNANDFTDFVDFLLGDLVEALGADVLPAPAEIDGPLGVLGGTGLLQAGGAKRGGRRPRDFEASFGNTGYQLLGLIVERVSGRSYDELVAERIVERLGLGPMALALEAPKRRGMVASEYAITTGAETAGLEGLDENLFGLYPLTDVNGHPALNLADAGPFVFTNGGGAAGGLAAAPDSYVRFFHALVTGGLLDRPAQEELENGFLAVEGRGFEHGFALFRSPSALGVLVTKGGATAGANCLAVHSLAGEGGNGVTAVACRNSADLFLGPDAGLPHSSADVDTLALDLVQLARP